MAKVYTREVFVAPHTFGGSKACEILADMMNQNVINTCEKHRVLSFINSVINQFNAVAYIPYQGVRMKAMTLIRDEIFLKVDKMSYPAKFINFLKNVISHHYRRALKGADRVIARSNS